MDDVKWERVAAATGIVFVALLVIGFVLVPEGPPKATADTTKIAAYYTKHRTGVLIAGYLSGLALVFGLWFAGSLRSFLRRAEGGAGRLSAVSFGAVLVAAAAALAATAVGNTLAFKAARQGDPAVVRALFDLTNIGFAFFWFPAAVWVAATSIVAMRTKAFPDWYGWAGPLVTVAFLVEGSGTYADSGPVAAGGIYGLVAFLILLLWVLVTSVLLIQRVGAQAPGQPGMVPG